MLNDLDSMGVGTLALEVGVTVGHAQCEYGVVLVVFDDSFKLVSPCLSLSLC
ncbi:hypothetical protein PSA5_25205 [Pseudomonas syringae pv. actinidiae]|nr:hypothetical protein [Pseudomonas syringae]GAO96080.1 hypothetical protein PSA5_25205 [Pseudomonas syringae pv. actinidiae]